MDTESLKGLLGRRMDECYAIRRELDRRAGVQAPAKDVDFTQYVTQ